MWLFKRKKEEKKVYLVNVTIDHCDSNVSDKPVRVYSNVDGVYESVCEAALFVMSEIERIKIVYKAVDVPNRAMKLERKDNDYSNVRVTITYENGFSVVTTYSIEEKVVK